ncbi:MAG: HAD family hydrolase [Christensenellales bacterium]|jgi:putative hydrolase of the HAD superfamily
MAVAGKNLIRGVVFDLDHTLYDRKTSDTLGLIKYFSQYPRQFAPGQTPESAAKSMWRGELDNLKSGWQALTDTMTREGVFAYPPTGQAFCDWFQRYYASAGVTWPCVYPLLHNLKRMGLKLGIITNGTQTTQQAKLDYFGFPSLIPEIIIASGQQAKPNPAPFIRMTSQLGCPANTLLYVGDNPINDVAASHSAGYIPVWVRTLPWWGDAQPPLYQIDTVCQLYDLICTEFCIT